MEMVFKDRHRIVQSYNSWPHKALGILCLSGYNRDRLASYLQLHQQAVQDMRGRVGDVIAESEKDGIHFSRHHWKSMSRYENKEADELAKAIM